MRRLIKNITAPDFSSYLYPFLTAINLLEMREQEPRGSEFKVQSGQTEIEKGSLQAWNLSSSFFLRAAPEDMLLLLKSWRPPTEESDAR